MIYEKRLFVTLFLIVSCLIGCGTDANNSEEHVQIEKSVNQHDGKDVEIKESPKVLMDLFSGERRIWLYVVGDKWDTDLSYDDSVAAVFDGMSDDEIISMVSNTYTDASIGYTFPRGEANLDKNNFPYKIQYKDDLDSSGNELKYEYLNVMFITLNNYPEFDNLELDDPNGMSDF